MQQELPLPPTDTDLPLRRPAHTSCAHCNDVVHQDDAVIKQYYQGRMTLVEHFCSDSCHHQWYINRLRRTGL